MSKHLTLVALIAMIGGLPTTALADEGQGTAQPGSHLGQLDPGKLLYGAAASPDDWLGQVVVVNIGGG